MQMEKCPRKKFTKKRKKESLSQECGERDLPTSSSADQGLICCVDSDIGGAWRSSLLTRPRGGGGVTRMKGRGYQDEGAGLPG